MHQTAVVPRDACRGICRVHNHFALMLMSFGVGPEEQPAPLTWGWRLWTLGVGLPSGIIKQLINERASLCPCVHSPLLLTDASHRCVTS